MLSPLPACENSLIIFWDVVSAERKELNRIFWKYFYCKNIFAFNQILYVIKKSCDSTFWLMKLFFVQIFFDVVKSVFSILIKAKRLLVLNQENVVAQLQSVDYLMNKYVYQQQCRETALLF